MVQEQDQAGALPLAIHLPPTASPREVNPEMMSDSRPATRENTLFAGDNNGKWDGGVYVGKGGTKPKPDHVHTRLSTMAGLNFSEIKEILPKESFYQTWKIRTLHSCLIVATIMHLRLGQLSLMSLICTSKGDKSVLEADPRMTCWSSEHIPLAIFSLLVFVM